jgi:hypothetical protein
MLYKPTLMDARVAREISLQAPPAAVFNPKFSADILSQPKSSEVVGKYQRTAWL